MSKRVVIKMQPRDVSDLFWLVTRGACEAAYLRKVHVSAAAACSQLKAEKFQGRVVYTTNHGLMCMQMTEYGRAPS